MARSPRKQESSSVVRKSARGPWGGAEENQKVRSNKFIEHRYHRDRRFSIISDDDDDDEVDEDEDYDNDEDDDDSEDEDYVEGSRTYTKTHNRKPKTNNRARVVRDMYKMPNNELAIADSSSDSSSSSYSSSSSSSDDDDYDEDVDLVALTKQRRARAMKAAKRLRYGDRQAAHKHLGGKGMKSREKIATTNKEKDQDEENDDNKVEKHKVEHSDDEDLQDIAIPGEENELDDSIVDAVISEEERKMDSDTLSNKIGNSTSNSVGDASECANLNSDKIKEDDLNIMDLSFSQKPVDKKQSLENPVQELNNEDLGEAVDEAIPDVSSKIAEEPITLAVPKLEEDDINSDSDYDFDPEELIRTLQNDDDELELFGNSDEDYRNVLGGGSEIQGLGIPPIVPDKNAGPGNYLMKEETQAMLSDVNASQYENAIMSDEDDDSTAKKHKLMEAEDAEGNNESNENEGEEKNGDDDDDDDDDDDSFGLLGYRDFLDSGAGSTHASLYVPQSELFSDGGDDSVGGEEIDLFAGDSEKGDLFANSSSWSVTSSSDEDENSNLLDCFFSSGSSSADEENAQDRALEDKVRAKEQEAQTDSDETDEDTTLPRKSTRKIGSKRAKEVLSSSSKNFRAPKLGTFIVSRNRKPFGIIDGYSTRFLYPKDNRLSILKGTHAALDVSKEDSLNNGYSSGDYVSGSASSNNQGLESGKSSSSSSAQDELKEHTADKKDRAVALDDLINISEFEDDDVDHDNSGTKWDSYFKKRRVPLTAFRTRTLMNSGALKNNNYEDATRKYTFRTAELPSSRRRHHHHHKHSGSHISRKLSASKLRRESFGLKKGGSKHYEGLKLGLALPKTGNHVSWRAYNNINSEQFIPDGIKDAVVVEPAMKLKHSTKKRLRRKSMAEAQAKGFRATKSGLFNEDMLKDVESMLVDIGAAEDCNFLFSAET